MVLLLFFHRYGESVDLTCKQSSYVVKQPGKNIDLSYAFRPFRAAAGAAFLLLCGVGFLRADLPATLTLDLPVSPDMATPSWLGHPETPATNFATLNLPILTPDTGASLLVTVYFQEKEGGFMRISWNGTQGAQVLSDNFYENIGMANQRSLLISPETLVGDGTLSFQCSDSDLNIERIKLEWLANKNSLVSPDVTGLLVTPSGGDTQPALTLNGQPNLPQPGAWQNQLVTVPLTDTALRIEQGVEFSVDLDKVPGSARLALKEAGLPLGKHLIVWVNEKRAGTITPAVPALADAGFLTDATATTSYVGWRDGSFYVPVALLKEGVNTLQLSDENDADPGLASASASTTGSEAPLAVKDLLLQLNYLSPAVTPAATTTTTDTTAIPPTSPIAPSDSSDTIPGPGEISSPPNDATITGPLPNDTVTFSTNTP